MIAARGRWRHFECEDGHYKQERLRVWQWLVWIDKIFCALTTGCRITPCPNFMKGRGGTKQGFLVKELHVGDAALQCYGQFVALQGHISAIQSLDNNNLFWSQLSLHKVWARNLIREVFLHFNKYIFLGRCVLFGGVSCMQINTIEIFQDLQF